MTDDLAKTTEKWLEYIVVKEEDPIPEYFDSTPGPLGENSLKPIAVKQEGDLAVDTDLCKHEKPGDAKNSSILTEEWTADKEDWELPINDDEMDTNISARCKELPKQNIIDDGNSYVQVKVEGCDCPDLFGPSTFVDVEAPNNVAEMDFLPFHQNDFVSRTAFPKAAKPVLKGGTPETQNTLYGCHHCGFRFRYLNQLEIHMRIHSREKPYACNVCNHTSVKKSNLRTHMLIHTGEKPHACELCSHKCHRSDDLKRHIRTQHIIKNPISCDFCDYTCLSRKFLAFHMRSHTGINFLKCDTCHLEFKTLASLNRHKKKHKSLTEMLNEILS